MLYPNEQLIRWLNIIWYSRENTTFIYIMLSMLMSMASPSRNVYKPLNTNCHDSVLPTFPIHLPQSLRILVTMQIVRRLSNDHRVIKISPYVFVDWSSFRSVNADLCFISSFKDSSLTTFLSVLEDFRTVDFSS